MGAASPAASVLSKASKVGTAGAAAAVAGRASRADRKRSQFHATKGVSSDLLDAIIKERQSQRMHEYQD